MSPTRRPATSAPPSTSSPCSHLFPRGCKGFPMSQSDLRLAAFLSDRTEVFHSIQHRHEIWRPDPVDVERVHEEARSAFERLLTRATTPPGLDSGRILLLLGESGCGKTHLVRAFRSRVHEQSL